MYIGIFFLFGLWAAAFTEDPILSVELTLQTRGTRKVINISPKQTRVIINEQRSQIPTQPKQWRAIVSALKELSLADLPRFPGDISRSAVDAALSARVRVTTGSQTYESAPYDHPNPPAPLARLVKAIVGSAPPASRNEFR